MKLTLTMPSGRIVELDEIPLRIELRGDPAGEEHPGVVLDVYTPVVFSGSALTINNCNPNFVSGFPAIHGGVETADAGH